MATTKNLNLPALPSHYEELRARLLAAGVLPADMPEWARGAEAKAAPDIAVRAHGPFTLEGSRSVPTCQHCGLRYRWDARVREGDPVHPQTDFDKWCVAQGCAYQQHAEYPERAAAQQAVHDAAVATARAIHAARGKEAK